MLTGLVEPTPRDSQGAAAKMRMFGQAQSAEVYTIRDFLMRSVVEFEWIELTCDDDCHEQLGLPELAKARLPVVISKRPLPRS
jgi:thioredoxin reductase (NADPH)